MTNSFRVANKSFQLGIFQKYSASAVDKHFSCLSSTNYRENQKKSFVK